TRSTRDWSSDVCSSDLAVRDGSDWVINGAKRFASGVNFASHSIIFARTSGEPGKARGITAFIVPTDAPGFEIPYFHWTFNMPTEIGRASCRERARVAVV